MWDDSEHDVAKQVLDRYLQRTPLSRQMDARAKESLPGGDTRTSTYYSPYPAYLAQGRGCYVEDIDGNRYIDFLNNYTSLIHGHAHPAVVRAATEQVVKGTSLGSPAEVTFMHAEHLRGRIPCLDLIRYCNSGTEATLLALRAARAFTQRECIVKMDGGYHGTHDFVEVNITADLDGRTLPKGRLENIGVPSCVLDGVFIVPFNDAEALSSVLARHEGEIAAVIMEPMLGSGGQVPPNPGYLKAVREATDRHGVLLIFDEIITLRLAVGGMQSVENVRPDLTTMGKIIGGGFPVGAFGGRREVMTRFDPTHGQRIRHAGTFNGNNITMAAGLAAMEAYDGPAIQRVNELGDQLRRGLDHILQAAGIRGHVGGRGSLLQIHWRAGEVANSRAYAEGVHGAGRLPLLLHLEMLSQGVLSAPRGQYCTSTAMGESDIAETVRAFGAAIATLLPYIHEKLPHLVS